MALNSFQYGVGAIVAPDQQDQFTSCTQKLIADTRPANFLEQLLVDQLLHAQWELYRANSLSSHVDAEEEILRASARATRNWSRANRELAALQTARASQILCRAEGESRPGPCADLAKVPKRRGPSAAAAQELHLHRRLADANEEAA